jgi:hypothetical protein
MTVSSLIMQGVLNGGTSSVAVEGGGGGGSYDADAVLAFAAMTVQPDATRKGLYSDLIAGLKTDGVWTLLDWLVIPAAHDRQAGRLNLKQLTKSLTEFGGTLDGTGASPNMLWTTDRGFQNGIATSANTNGLTVEALNTAGNNLTNINVHVSAWINNFDFQNFGGIWITTTPYNHEMGQDSATKRFGYRINDSTFAYSATDATASNFFGFWCANRTGTNTRKLFHGSSVAVANDSAANISSTSATLKLLASDIGINMDQPHHTTRLAAFSMGQGLTDPQEAALYARINTFLTAVGGA